MAAAYEIQDRFCSARTARAPDAFRVASLRLPAAARNAISSPAQLAASSCAEKSVFSKNGAVIPIDRLVQCTAITGAGNYFDWPDTDGDDAQALAEKFVVRFPDIAIQGKGRDWAYAGWFAELVGFLERGDWLPVVEWEHMKGKPEEGLSLHIVVAGKENFIWEGNESIITPDNPTFPLPPS